MAEEGEGRVFDDVEANDKIIFFGLNTLSG
jgi:hypothetical protein